MPCLTVFRANIRLYLLRWKGYTIVTLFVFFCVQNEGGDLQHFTENVPCSTEDVPIPSKILEDNSKLFEGVPTEGNIFFTFDFFF